MEIFLEFVIFAVIVNNRAFLPLAKREKDTKFRFVKYKKSKGSVRKNCWRGFIWMVAPWVFIQRLKSQNRPFKKYHNTFCCHFLLQTFAQVLFSILSQEKLNTMIMQNFRGTQRVLWYFLQKAYYVQNKSYFLKELLNRYYLHGHSIRLKL